MVWTEIDLIGRHMIWLLKRIGLSILLVWIVASVVFMAVHLVPGDPAELLLSSGGLAPDPAAVEAAITSKTVAILPCATGSGWTSRSSHNMRTTSCGSFKAIWGAR